MNAMPTPSKYKTVQARILAYAQAIGWTYVPQGEAETRRGVEISGLEQAAQSAGAAYAGARPVPPGDSGCLKSSLSGQ